MISSNYSNGLLGFDACFLQVYDKYLYNPVHFSTCKPITGLRKDIWVRQITQVTTCSKWSFIFLLLIVYKWKKRRKSVRIRRTCGWLVFLDAHGIDLYVIVDFELFCSSDKLGSSRTGCNFCTYYVFVLKFFNLIMMWAARSCQFARSRRI